MTIHKEGRRFLVKFFSFVIAAVYGAFYFFPENEPMKWAIIAVFVFFFLLFLNFFRIPAKKIVKNDNQIICPCDGKVVVIEEVLEDEYLNDKRRQISIFMSPLNVHNNLNPVGGVVSYFKYHAGKYLMAFNPKSSIENERTTVVVKNDKGIEILYRQIAGFLARRICWYIAEGDSVEQSEEFGFIKFGSRIDVFLPLDAKINVEIGQVTTGGQTVLAEFS